MWCLRFAALASLSLWIFGCCSIPSYTPAYWNTGGTAQYDNNCYNYGNNNRTDTFAQPGRRAGAMYSGLSCTEVYNAAVADGLTAVPTSGVCPSNHDLVALVVDPGTDYHWYRRDGSGMWSHKPGGTQATNLDNSGALISDPATADRCGGYLCYSDFCGLMCSCSSSTEGSGHEDIN